MHLLVDDGVPLARPVELRRDAEGARLLARLYAPPADRVHVRAMMNTTVDGAIAGADGISGSLRNPDDSFLFSVLRALADVILVGARTVREEDYHRPQGRADLLETSLRPGGAERPALAVRTRTGLLPGTLEADQPTVLLVPSAAREAVLAAGIVPPQQVLVADAPADAIARLAELGHRAVQVEGGPGTLGELVAAGAVDELCFSITHRTVGGPSPRVLEAPGHDRPWRMRSLILGEHATMVRWVRG